MERGVGDDGTHGVEGLAGGTRHQQRLAPRHEPFGDAGNLGRGFAYTEDNFGESVPALAIEVDARESEIVEGWRRVAVGHEVDVIL